MPPASSAPTQKYSCCSPLGSRAANDCLRARSSSREFSSLPRTASLYIASTALVVRSPASAPWPARTRAPVRSASSGRFVRQPQKHSRYSSSECTYGSTRTRCAAIALAPGSTAKAHCSSAPSVYFWTCVLRSWARAVGLMRRVAALTCGLPRRGRST
eukprot:366336-Chlamydomonas_euryale.AAC.5